jgi:glycosyltransferase involved in cell wall biosynthesis
MHESHLKPPVRVLYSFPHKIGADRICTTAWHQVEGITAVGADALVYTGVVHRPLSDGVRVRTTLARGGIRVPYRVLGHRRSFRLHDRVVAHALPKLAGDIDVVHVWPLGARETLRAATRLGIPTVLERPNAHTRFAYEVVAKECERLGITLPPDHEHAYNPEILRHEEEEYELADYLLCPSDFVVKTFRDQGFPPEKLLRHTYGFDPSVFSPPAVKRPERAGLTVLFAGVAAVRKGLHLALEAWLRSPASAAGTFLIAGDFVPAYRERLSELLSHPSVRALGHRTDLAELMRSSDVLVLPSLEEGYGLVCIEAIGSGCVPLVSDACTDVCRHLDNALVHSAGDVDALAEHLTLLHNDRSLLERLRQGALATAPDATWDKAGEVLVDAYRHAIECGPAQRHDAAAAKVTRPSLRA